MKNFTDCDKFASYITDHVLDFGEFITNEFNEITGLKLPIGYSVYQLTDLPNTGSNYAKFGTFKSWLYDLYFFSKMNEVEKLIFISGKPLKELAIILDTTKPRISEYKHGKHKISVEKLKNWCQLLDIDIKTLF